MSAGGPEVEVAREGERYVVKIRLPPGVAPPGDIQVVSLEPLLLVGGVREAAVEEVLKDAEPRNAKYVLRYPGGDYPLRNVLRQLFERAQGVDTFVEVFGGSGLASYIVTRDLRRKYRTVIYNDVDEDLVNFFRVLREKPHELIRKLALMPLSRSLREEYRDQYLGGFSGLDGVERAVRFYYLLHASVNALAANPNSFRSAAGKDLPQQHLNTVAALPEFARVWMRIQVERLDFRKCIEKFDSPRTLFYCDPPHLSLEHRRPLYRHSFTLRDLHDLVKLLSRARGRFVLKVPEDHLKIPFVGKFAEKHEVLRADVARHLIVDEGERKDRLAFVLVHNLDERSGAGLERWL